MAILFAGGEDNCFTKIGSDAAPAVSTTAGFFRTNYARNCLLVPALAGTTPDIGWSTQFLSSTDIWFSARLVLGDADFSTPSYYPATSKVLSFNSDAVRRLVFTPSVSGGAGSLKWRVSKVNSSGVSTSLAVMTTGIVQRSLVKIDVNIKYAVAGYVKVYIDSTLVLDTGVVDVTTDGVSTLNGLVLGGVNNGTSLSLSNLYTTWSECIVSTTDTRNLSLLTLTPLAAGNAQQWTGAVADVNESILNDVSLISSATAGQIGQFTVDPSKNTAAVGGQAVLALATHARSLKGTTGPTNLQLGIRTGGVDYWSSNKAQDTLFAPSSNLLETNPATGALFTTAELSAAGFNIGVKSVA